MLEVSVTFVLFLTVTVHCNVLPFTLALIITLPADTALTEYFLADIFLILATFLLLVDHLGLDDVPDTVSPYELPLVRQIELLDIFGAFSQLAYICTISSPPWL